MKSHLATSGTFQAEVTLVRFRTVEDVACHFICSSPLDSLVGPICFIVRGFVFFSASAVTFLTWLGHGWSVSL